MFFNGREATKVAPQYPLAAGQENRVPPEPRLQTNPREDLRELRANEDAVLNELRLGGQEHRRRPDPDRRGDEADDRARTARAPTGNRPMKVAVSQSLSDLFVPCLLAAPPRAAHR